jgi:hypothetical protein
MYVCKYIYKLHTPTHTEAYTIGCIMVCIFFKTFTYSSLHTLVYKEIRIVGGRGAQM